MELILTSFGVSHLQDHDTEEVGIFSRMPPVSMSEATQPFMPDYAILLLADRIILDRKTYDLLVSEREHDWSFGAMARMVRLLHDEGLIRLENFDFIIQKNRSTLEVMLETDLKELDLWVPAMKQSLAIWRDFMKSMRGRFGQKMFSALSQKAGKKGEEARLTGIHWLHDTLMPAVHGAANFDLLLHVALESSTKRRRREYRDALRRGLSKYLSYVNANLLLSASLQAGFYDWSDFLPFYREKFLRVAQEGPPKAKHMESIKRLFEVSFPEFTFWQPENVIRALKDDRIQALREQVNRAASNEVKFDEQFARRVLGEVLRVEQSVGKFRKLVSYITAPLGFIPVFGTPLQKATEETIVRPVARKKRKSFQWFYLMSELAEKSRTQWSKKEEEG